MFVPGNRPSMVDAEACYIVISEGRILAPEGDGWSPLDAALWRFSNPQRDARNFCIGHYRGRDCFVAVLEGCPQVEGHYWADLRQLMATLDEAHFAMGSRALQIQRWRRDHRFCGRCGQPTVSCEPEMARHCPSCELYFYPRLSPCVIVLVTRGDHCLLARNKAFPPGMFSTLAGFIEAGETVESALRREVAEEVGVSIDGFEYFGSQPWPFPSQLMIGFHARYAGGELCPDDDEIDEAYWFRYDELPPRIPPETTISGQLIRHFVEQKTRC